MSEAPHVVVVTGMSGAGRSLSAKVLEDLGYFVVDNLPPPLLEMVVEQNKLLEHPRQRLAVVADTRGGLSFEDLEEALNALEGAGIPSTVLFLDADDDILARRYEENRRPHPVEAPSLAESIARERGALEGLRGEADVLIDTTDRNVHETRRILEDTFTGELPRRPLRVTVTSFGFKRGTPRVLDMLFDVRFLPNPHWEPELRPLTGLDQPVSDYVLGQPDATEFLERTRDMLAFLLPRYQAEGKAYLAIGVGCTGGHHRSVAIAEELRDWLESQGVEATVRHRDADGVSPLGVALDPLLQELEASFEGPAVVAIGGGHGLAQALAAIMGYAGAITAVVGVTDDGGSSGRLTELGLPPPGDIRRCLVALAPEPSVWRDLFDHRFADGDVAGHALGNLMLAALADLHGDFEDGLKAAEQLLGSRGEVVPAARAALRLQAVIDGREVTGQLRVTTRRGTVTELRAVPGDVPANPRAVEAIGEADQIVVGPGSLYSSLAAPLLIPGMADAINRCSGRLVYVANLTTQDAETLGMDAVAHVEALLDLTAVRPPDAILVNSAPVSTVVPVEPLRVDETALKAFGSQVVSAPLAAPGSAAALHDPIELGTALARLATA